MKKLGFAVGVALLASTAIAQAGGIERTSQSVDILFEEGTLNTTPSASDVDPAPLSTNTGIIAKRQKPQPLINMESEAKSISRQKIDEVKGVEVKFPHLTGH